jgi:TonB family protein
MKPSDDNNKQDNKQDEVIFKTVTELSGGNSWVSSLVRQFREYQEEKKHPHQPVRITAQSDPSALNKLVEMPSPFSSLVSQIRGLIYDSQHPHHIEMTATPVAVEDIWSEQHQGMPRVLSVFVHVGIVTLLLIPWATSMKKPVLTSTNVLLAPPDALVLTLPDKSGGGGGGGKHELTQPSLGHLPKAADKQFVPPDPEPPKNLDPALVMEPTVVAPQLAAAPQLSLLNIGDPNGVAGPPSSGPGSGGGIGTGNGHGVGEGNGPGVGPGNGGGYGGGVFKVGGGVSAPVLVHQVLPQYSEEARKARFQGTVLLETIVRKDGTVQVIRVTRSLGFGLDEQAIKAAQQWTFRPGMKNGQPVDISMYIEVNFNLR